LDRLSASLPGIKWVYPLGYTGLQKNILQTVILALQISIRN
jgi:hypothetical protein